MYSRVHHKILAVVISAVGSYHVTYNERSDAHAVFSSVFSPVGAHGIRGNDQLSAVLSDEKRMGNAVGILQRREIQTAFFANFFLVN